ncbi:hypothetical protein KR026_011780, partial [Drosophila bipectinata]
MGSPLVWLLLVAVCTVSFLGESSAVCCTDNMTIKFWVKNNNCGALNAKKVSGGFCQMTICGDGERLVGYYCGKGPCNIFGCACEGGCRHGNWVESFLARNRRHEVSVMDASGSNE